MRVQDALAEAERQLGGPADHEARIKARVLMQHTLGVDSAGLVSAEPDHLGAAQAQRYRDLVTRTVHEPLYRVIGAREFHGLSLTLHPDTLEPRDDTETLVECVLDRLRGRREEGFVFADLGTGTGAVGLALLSDLPQARAVLTDLSANALETARANASRNGLAGRCRFAAGSWFEALAGAGTAGQTFDFIVSNPPYIAREEIGRLDAIVQLHDPHQALDGGEDGLDAYRAILAGAAVHLASGGFLALEIGYDQAASVRALAEEAGWTCEGVYQDLGGRDRVVVLM